MIIDALTQEAQMREGLRLETSGLASTSATTTRSIESESHSREYLSTSTGKHLDVPSADYLR